MTDRARRSMRFIVNSVDDARFAAFAADYAGHFGPDAPPLTRVRDARSMCEGNNRGVRMGPPADWYVFCHDDIRFLSPDAAEIVAEAMEACDMFGVAGTRRLVSGNWYDAGQPYTLGQVVARTAERADRYELQIFGPNSGTLQQGAASLDGILIACRADLFERLGGFDEETFRDFHGYDVDFSFRASLAGARVAVSEALLLLHDSTVADFSEAKLRAWEEAQRSFAARLGQHLSAEPGRRGHRTIPLASLAEGVRHLPARPRPASRPVAPRPDLGQMHRKVTTNGSSTMKLACFTMFRNEAAILGPFLDQLAAFFDHAVLLNHGSTDGGPEMVTARQDPRFELLQLQAPGYPQSEVATGMARRILDRHAPDFLFFLDCDEFLPFADRPALEAFLEGFRNRDGLLLRWQHVCPEAMDGGNIFEGRFLRAAEPSHYTKLVLNGRLAARSGWSVCQGYHALQPGPGESVDLAETTAAPLLHMPVQSRSQFRFKVAAGASRIRRDAVLMNGTLGGHWVQFDTKARRGELDAATLRNIALAYPEVPTAPVPAAPLDFTFPYVHTPFAETPAVMVAQLDGLLQVMDTPPVPADARSFSVMAPGGDILLSSAAATGNGAALPAPVNGSNLAPGLFSGSLAEDYATLVEPLFNLPTKLPLTAWSGHIPFLFALIRAVRPARYVDLGVHYGASLIAAATAARTYNLATECIGVDTWEGDEHAGRYAGDAIYHDLSTYMQGTFRNVTLMRCLFAEARKAFHPGSIDILHIDGLHTYDAVKEDFTTWFDLVSPQGVILFHDTNVFRSGFGVHRFWAEVRQHFPSLEFYHSHGLGVLFLGPEGERFAPFLRLLRDPAALRGYQGLVSDIGSIIEERMAGFELGSASPAGPSAELEGLRRTLQERQAAIEEIRASTSWRVTRPLRAVKRLMGS